MTHTDLAILGEAPCPDCRLVCYVVRFATGDVLVEHDTTPHTHDGVTFYYVSGQQT